MRPKCKYTHLWIIQEYVLVVTAAAAEQQESLVHLDQAGKRRPKKLIAEPQAHIGPTSNTMLR